LGRFGVCQWEFSPPGPDEAFVPALDPEDKDPLALVGVASFRRRPQVERRAETHFFQRSGCSPAEIIQYAPREEAGDVLEGVGDRVALADDADGLSPEPALVGVALALARGAGGLAGRGAKDEIHAATPGGGVESAQVGEDGRVVEDSLSDPGDNCGAGVSLSLDVRDDPDSGEGEFESDVEGPCTRTQTDGVDGTSSGIWSIRAFSHGDFFAAIRSCFAVVILPRRVRLAAILSRSGLAGVFPKPSGM
jgi:hypothetical protein